MATILTNSKYYKNIADAIRQKYGVEIEYKPSEMAAAIESIDVGEVVYSSDGVAFNPDKVDPDVNYKVGRNWLADLVEIVQKMAGKKSGMTLEDMIYWLNRVQFIPQGNAESINNYAVSQVSIATGIIPVVQIGIALSENEYASSQESSAVSLGLLPLTLTGAKCYYNNVLLPGIPEDMLTKYPYVWILQNDSSDAYQLIFGTKPWYYKSGMYGNGSITTLLYSVPISTAADEGEWVFGGNNSSTYYTLDNDRIILWSNCDIPNGSADATDIYFRGSEPVPVEEV